MIILFFDDEKWRHDAMDRRSIGHVVHHAYSIRQFKDALSKHHFDYVSLDHDITDDDSETGMDAVRHLAKIPRERVPARIVVHSWNQPRAAEMMDALQQAGFAPERRMFQSMTAERTAEAERRWKERNE